jgi:inosine/xanthosine triphosphate pyrophosphatase family protein
MAKSTRPIVRIYNIETDELIDREMNDAEFAEYQADQEIQAAKKAEATAKAAEKQAILDRIGLTADELQSILG